MADDLDAEIAITQQQRGPGLTEFADDDALGFTQDRFAGFEGSIAAGNEMEDDGEEVMLTGRRAQFTAPKHLLGVPHQESEDAITASQRSNRIADREDEYHARRQRVLSPSRADAFALGDKTPDIGVRSYKEVMSEQQVARERDELRRKIKEQETVDTESGDADGVALSKKRRRWDQPAPGGQQQQLGDAGKKFKTRWDDVATPGPASSRWDATPTPGRESTGAAVGGSQWDATPTPGRVLDASKWDATPTPGRVVDSSKWDATPTPGALCQRSNAQTPQVLAHCPCCPQLCRSVTLTLRGLVVSRCAGRAPAVGSSKWDTTPTPGRVSDGSKWDATPTPGRVTGTTSVSRWDAAPTPGREGSAAGSSSRWDATPTPGRPEGAASGSRWDATPTPGRVDGGSK